MDKQPDSVCAGDVAGIMDDAVRGHLRTFAGHIAHDFNNLLTPLLAYPQLIRNDLRRDASSGELLDVMEDISETMANIAHRLADFALPRSPTKHMVSVDAVIQEIIADLEHDNLALGVTIAPLEDSGLGVTVPHDALSGPITEICTNALESMKGSGTLSLKVDVLKVEDPFTVMRVQVPPGQYARISVCDTGPGMSDEVRNMAFDPFFSTNMFLKARGAGLGLTIALATVRDCGGFIVLGDSHSGGGFTVSILLPEAQKIVPVTEGELPPEVLQAEVSDNPKGRVLVVDDEAPITELFKLMLESMIPSIEVDVAGNGCEAVEAFTARRHEVVVMDLHMPEMDGQSAFAALTKLCRANEWQMPGVVFCTGYAPPEGIKDAIAGDSQHDLLHKPVTSEALANAVKFRLSASC